MDIESGSPGAHKFITNVGLITSNGPHGQNIMAAEWTHQISYEPGLIAICIQASCATHANIEESKEFGVSIASVEQNAVSSIAGGSHGFDVDKINVLKKLGVEFYPAKKINCLMVKDAAFNVECKLLKKFELGDHIMFVGEAVEVFVSDKEPLAHTQGKYWKIGERIQKPPKEVLDRVAKLVEENKK